MHTNETSAYLLHNEDVRTESHIRLNMQRSRNIVKCVDRKELNPTNINIVSKQKQNF